MRILYRNGIFAAVNTIEEKPALQKAGFNWHKGEECAFGSRSCYACKAGLKRAWWTRRHEAAARLSAYADESARKALAEHLHAVEMSRATDSDVEIPCPKNRSYLGYQRAGIAYMAKRDGTLLGDEQGCVDGQAIIAVNRAGKGFKISIADAYKRFHCLSKRNWNWDPTIPTYARSLCDGYLLQHRVKNILMKGTKKTILLKLKSGKSVNLTPDHLVAAPNGKWIAAGKLKRGTRVLTNGTPLLLKNQAPNICPFCGNDDDLITYPYSKFLGFCKKCMYRKMRAKPTYKGGKYKDKDGYVLVTGMWDHPRAQRRGHVYEHILVAEKKIGRSVLPHEEVHHKNKLTDDNSPNNLEVLSKSEHKKADKLFLNMDGGTAGRGGKITFVPKIDVVASVKKSQPREVYDLVMEDPHRNFVANGIVVHNCGKTIQVMGLINLDQTIKNVLVVVPARLRINWRREAHAWLVPDGRRWLIHIVDEDAAVPSHANLVIIHYNRVTIGHKRCGGPCGGEKRKPIICPKCKGTGNGPREPLLCEHCQGKKFTFCKMCKGRGRTPATNIKVVESITKRKWDLIVADECHWLKNLKAKRTRAVLGDRFNKKPGLIDLARKKLCLTGTPIPNKPYEIWPIASALAPDDFGSFKQFARRYCNGRNEWVSKTKQVFRMDGATNLEELQEKLRGTCLLRRLKKDVLKDLPAKRRQIIELPASDEAKKLIAEELSIWEKKFGNDFALAEAAMQMEGNYETAVENLKYIQAVAFMEMAKIRRQVAVVKIPEVTEHIEALFDEGVEKIVCFAHHREVIEKLQTHFGEKAVSVYGGTKMDASQRAIDTFQDPKSKIRLFIGGITAVGVGVTLTAASTVVFAELDWTPGNLNQCEDRLHRIGQPNSVLVQHLVLNGSLDARMAQMVVEKQEIADRALDKDTTIAVNGINPPRPTVELPVDPIPVWKKIAVKEALIVLAQRRDPTTEGGHGFNQFDGPIGQSLATFKGMLSDRQAHLGMRLITKYRRQLSMSNPPLAKQLEVFEEQQAEKPTHRRANALANVYDHKQLKILDQLIPPKIAS